MGVYFDDFIGSFLLRRELVDKGMEWLDVWDLFFYIIGVTGSSFSIFSFPFYKTKGVAFFSDT